MKESKIIIPPDGGPIYAETDLSLVFSEPWNAISSLALVMPALYWATKLKWNFRDYPFIFWCIPLLCLGGTGSTFYHAFRISPWLLWLDVLPTLILTISVGIYFWFKLIPTKWVSSTIVLVLTSMRFMVHSFYDGSFATNLSYFISGVMIFLPIIFYVWQSNFKDALTIFLSVGFLSISLWFRQIDLQVVEILPMGSHFLWHLFSGFGAYFLAKYLYLLRYRELIPLSESE